MRTHTSLVSFPRSGFTIAKQITNRVEFTYFMVGDIARRMLVTHILNHFPHQRSVNLKKPCPVGQTGIILLLF